MERIRRILRQWVPLAIAVTGLCGLVYLAVQQELRQNANDPQIQIAEDAAAVLEGGASPESVVPAGTVDIGRSLSPFLMVFDDRGAVAGSSAELHGRTPEFPGGVLDYVRTHGEDRVTWQPEEGVRIAAVVVRFQGASPGFVLAGRSLREVETREDGALLEAAAACLTLLAATLVAAVFGEFLPGEKRS
jgi:hypothetical protein